MKTKKLYDDYMITGMVAGFQPLEIEDATGCTVTGSDGKQFLDCFSGISVCNAGHGHPEVIAAAKKQIDKLVHCCTYIYYNPRAGEFAKVLAEITPGKLQQSFFGNSGAEAIEGALRLAKQHTGRNEIIALTQSFHGRTYATLSITGNSARKINGGPYMPGVAFAPAPYFYRCPFNSATEEECGERSAMALRDVIKYQTSNNVAAFIAEPVMGEGGIIVPPPNYFKLVKEILDDLGILFIADEVQSGFGRTGKLFAIEHYGVEPDMMTMAKGIADGFPLSSFTTTPEIASAFKPGDHLSTFGGSPVSCAAALANMNVMQKENLPQKAEQSGNTIMAAMQKVKEDCSLIGDIRGKGLMIGIELVKDTDKTPAAAEAKEVRTRCLKKGLLVGIGGTLANVVRLQPPLVITDDEIGKAIAILSDVIQQVNNA